MNIEKELRDWHGSVHERVETLCAIYKCPKLGPTIGNILMVDSTINALLKTLYSYTGGRSEESETVRALCEMATECLRRLIEQSMDILDVPTVKQQQLLEDIISIVNTRYTLETRINDALENEDDENEG